MIPELWRDSEPEEENDEVVSTSVANLVVITELIMVFDCWVIVESDVNVAVGIRQDTLPFCWTFSA